MIQDFFINEIIIKKRSAITVYENWISRKTYNEQCRPVRCRISHLSYKDLQLISDTDNVQRNVMKLYTNSDIDIDPKDIIVWEDKEWTVIAEYRPQDKNRVHHNKYFIKKVE